MKAISAFGFLAFTLVATTANAALITSLPGPDDQGGMIMPMITLYATSGPASNPTGGTVNISFSPGSVPVLKTTQEWSPGSWYADTAAWKTDLGSATGVGGTPIESAGNGDRFNNQYGFTFMSMNTMMAANVPTGNALAIRLDSISSAAMKSFNYSMAANRWDPVFNGANSQVLWNGSMWHNYFTLPANAPAGNYTARFEIFVANESFTGGTGFAQYDSAALNATKNNSFTSAFVTYQFTVIPEPASCMLTLFGAVGLVNRRRRNGSRIAPGKQ